MSRLARKPIEIPAGVTVINQGDKLLFKGPKGELSQTVHPTIEVGLDDKELSVKLKDESEKNPMLGTTCKLLQNMIKGVATGFEKKLTLVGVGYRAKVAGNALQMTLGYSHPIEYAFPQGITIECPSQTEILIKGADKAQVGEVAAKIRAFRKVEPYKGKGVRYADERVNMKEAKKK